MHIHVHSTKLHSSKLQKNYSDEFHGSDDSIADEKFNHLNFYFTAKMPLFEAFSGANTIK